MIKKKKKIKQKNSNIVLGGREKQQSEKNENGVE
jgi:hypothetical protein